MTKPNSSSWSGLELALNGIDNAIENLAWVQGMNEDYRMYQAEIEQLRRVRVKVKEDFKIAFKPFMEGK